MQNESRLTEVQRSHFKNSAWAGRVDAARMTLNYALFICQDLIDQEERKAVDHALEEFIERVYAWCLSAEPVKKSEAIS
jgi:hypothetical protein